MPGLYNLNLLLHQPLQPKLVPSRSLGVCLQLTCGGTEVEAVTVYKWLVPLWMRCQQVQTILEIHSSDGIADIMAVLQTEGGLLRGEHNLLGEAFLIMASAAGVQQQLEVLAWLLELLVFCFLSGSEG
ncbi:hypothetical protein P3S68_024229 [Capsicum galapagoense]